MNNIFYVISLGVLQGLTEFLPISSSGHLVILQHFLGFRNPQVSFDLALHLGTLGAVIVVYRQRLWELIKSGVSVLIKLDFYRCPRQSELDNDRNLV
jgi:undecaprenyl-diphosphatase